MHEAVIARVDLALARDPTAFLATVARALGVETGATDAVEDMGRAVGEALVPTSWSTLPVSSSNERSSTGVEKNCGSMLSSPPMGCAAASDGNWASAGVHAEGARTT